MSADRPTLSTFNHFTFKEEAHMRLWFAYWEHHAEAFFEELAPLGCLRISLNRVWNKEGLYKTSALFEYENPEAFKACQERIDAWRNTDAFQKEMGSLEAVIEATRNIIIQDLRRD